MAGIIYWKLRSQIAFNTVVFDGHFASVAEVKSLIADKMALGADAGNQLVLSHPTTGAEYKEDTEQLPRGTSVLVRRVPAGQQRLQPLLGATHAPAAQAAAQQPGQQVAAAEAKQQQDEFGADPFAQAAADAKRAQEEAAARTREAAAAASAAAAAAAAERGGRGGMAGRGRGRGKVPPHATYICPRCNRVGQHWVNDCPTRDDASFDVRAVRTPAGIPMGKMMNNPDGSILLPGGGLGQLATNTAAYEAHVAQMMGVPLQAEAAPLAIEAPKPAEPPQAAPQPEPQQQTQQQAALQQPPEPVAAPAPASPKPEPAPASPANQPQQQTAMGTLFDADDDIFNVAAKRVTLADAVPTNSGAGASKQPVLAPQSVTAPDQIITEEELAAAQLRLEREQIPADLRRPFCTPKEFLDYLPLLAELLPTAPARLLLKAFSQGVPLTRTEFQQLKDQEAQSQQQAEQQKPAGRGSRAEEDRNRRSRHRSRSRSRSRSRTRSKSRERARARERERERERSSRRSRRQESPVRAGSQLKVAPSTSHREPSVKRTDSLRARNSKQEDPKHKAAKPTLVDAEEPAPAEAPAASEAPAPSAEARAASAEAPADDAPKDSGGAVGTGPGDDSPSGEGANGHAAPRVIEESSHVVDAHEAEDAAAGSDPSKEATADDRLRQADEEPQPSGDDGSGSDDAGSSGDEGGDDGDVHGSSGQVPEAERSGREHRSHSHRRSKDDGDRSKKHKKHKHKKHKDRERDRDRDRDRHKKEKSSRRSRSKDADTGRQNGDHSGRAEEQRQEKPARKERERPANAGSRLFITSLKAAAQDVPYSERAEARKRRFGDAATSGAAAGRQEGDRWGHDKYEPADSVRGHKRRY